MPPKGQKWPTPYQIFALKKNEAYSKSRFYHLVKIYHPDRGGTSASSMSHEMKSERYRLVVAANVILSDPAKRNAYDKVGAGWDGNSEVAGSAKNGPFGSNQGWRDPSDPVWKNATWEDWERWREARDDEAMGIKREKQSPLYMNNGTFVALITLMALMGGGADVQAMSGREERIQWFLRNREATMGIATDDVETMRQEKTDRLLPNREICRSEDIVESGS
jgi:DnaJ-class molecular chaperone